MVQGQCHEGQGHKGQSLRSKVIGQGHIVKFKAIGGVLYPIDPRDVRHADDFIQYAVNGHTFNPFLLPKNIIE